MHIADRCCSCRRQGSEAAGQIHLTKLGEYPNPDQPKQLRWGGKHGIEGHQGQAQGQSHQGEVEDDHQRVLARAQGAHAYVGKGGEQGTGNGDQYGNKRQGRPPLQQAGRLGDKQHPEPAQGHGRQHALADWLTQQQPGQQGRERRVEVLQHRGRCQGQGR